MVGDDKLVLSLGWDGARIAGVAVASSRRPEVSRVLEGKTPEQVKRMVPMLFSLCGRAQETAAVMVLETALGQAPNGDIMQARERRVLAEAATEYLWRILVDWPSLIGEAPEMEALAKIRSQLRQAGDSWGEFSQRLEAFLEQNVLAMPLAAWLEMGGVERWAGEAKTVAARVVSQLLAGEGAFGDGGVVLMPSPESDSLLQEIEPSLRDLDDFPARPTWDGTPRETGALARTVKSPIVRDLKKRAGNTVALRFVARLAELAEMSARLAKRSESPSWTGAASPRPDWGLAWVECARGLLLHQAQVEEGRVVRYRIVAPTEWNFHPDGPLVRGLQGVAAASEQAAKSRAIAMVQALDPCVAYEIGVYHA